MPLTADELEQLRRIWAEHPSGKIESGAIQHLGLYLADHHAPEAWHREAAILRPRVEAVLRLAEHATPSETARMIALQAEFYAADELEARVTRPKVVPIEAVREQRAARPVVEKLSDILLRVVKQIETPVPAISTPFDHLNRLLLGGFRPGELIYIGARPGQGKSALGLEIMRKAARQGLPVLFVSREMSLEALGRRLLAQDGRLDAGSMRTGKQVDWQGVTRTVDRLYALPAYFTQHARTIEEIHKTAQGIEGLALIVVDYLQLLQSPREIKDRRLQVEYLSAKLKAMAMFYAIPVVVLSSLARPESKAAQRPPTLASLRDSGSLEHDADTVMLLHRPDQSNRTQCIVAKSRDAMTGIVELIFHADSVAFDEAMTEEEERRYGN